MADVRIAIHGVTLLGSLVIPDAAPGIVVFAHGSGSSRLSPRNREVAEFLQEAGLGTLLFDLLTVEEERDERHTGHRRFDIDLLATRLEIATEWLMSQPAARGRPLGYFGASTGAAAALVAAARLEDMIGAVVSRGGRPDLAGPYLSRVSAPTLLIVGERDEPVLELNQSAYMQMLGTREMIVVPRATHLFEEHGAMEQVAALASGWFLQHLPAIPPPAHHVSRSLPPAAAAR
jgi:predicted alpha/beta-hydrolase family hydrolase